LELGQHRRWIEALVDTGFDGHVTVPPGWISTSGEPDGALTWVLADGSEIVAPYYRGFASLESLGTFPALITIVAAEPLIGRALTDLFAITLDHGQRLIVEP
jgi:predicted aspartyl protease